MSLSGSLTRGTTLPDSSAKSDFHNLIDNSTVTISGTLPSTSVTGTFGTSSLDLSTITQNLVMTSKILKLAKGADVASVAGTMTLGDDGNYFDITGTNAITSITAKAAGTVVTLQFDSTASLVDGSNLKLNGNFTGAAEAQITLVSDGTNWFEVSRNSVSYTPTASNALSGSVLQCVNTQTGAVATGTTAIPNDDTIPQNTEGDEYFTRAITPSNSSNLLQIDVSVYCSNSGNALNTLALFQDSTANALAAVGSVGAANAPNTLKLSHRMTAGTTSSTTFKVRVGGESGTVTLNGVGGARKYGGVASSSITIYEIKA